MSYSEIINQLFLRSKSHSTNNLDSMVKFCKVMGNPQSCFKSIHIAGTNGKGSVATKIAATLQESGYRVGLFTSPHLYSYCERIQVNARPISEDQVESGLKKLLNVIDSIDPSTSFFHITTLLAFLYFKENKVDFAVIETGIGGRYDPTNVIDPILSIITTIGFDHMSVLGETLDLIALQKAGIIKPKTPLVLGPTANNTPIILEAKRLKSPIHFVSCTNRFYDAINASIAKKALEVIETTTPLKLGSINIGLKTRPLCRFQQVDRFIFDVAHNLDGFLRLIEAIELHFPAKPYSIFIALSKDKDLKSILKFLTSKAHHIYLLESMLPRLASTETLREILINLNFTNYSAGKTFKEYKSQLPSDQLGIICGSFYIMEQTHKEVIGS